MIKAKLEICEHCKYYGPEDGDSNCTILLAQSFENVGVIQNPDVLRIENDKSIPKRCPFSTEHLVC